MGIFQNMFSYTLNLDSFVKISDLRSSEYPEISGLKSNERLKVSAKVYQENL